MPKDADTAYGITHKHYYSNIILDCIKWTGIKAPESRQTSAQQVIHI